MNIRLRGLALMAAGVGFFCVLYYLILGREPGALTPRPAAAWPLVLVLIGAIEPTSGYPFYQVAQKWDAMPALTRFLLGLVVVTLSIPLIWIVLSAFMARA